MVIEKIIRIIFMYNVEGRCDSQDFPRQNKNQLNNK